MAPAQTRARLTGCPPEDVKALLRSVGLRPTRQRLALACLLFGKGDRHITAEALYREAEQAKVPLSLATVYNTLNQFKQAGMVRQISFDGSKLFFCTSTDMHHHFFVEDEHRVIDITDSNFTLDKIPTPPEGYEITHIDLRVGLRRKSATSNAPGTTVIGAAGAG